MTTKRLLRVKIPVRTSLARVFALSVLVAFSARAQQAGAGGAPVKSFAATSIQEHESLPPVAFTSTAGNAVFLPPVTYEIGGGLSSSVAVADVNGDGKPDIVTVSGEGGPNGDGLVDVLLGNGDGTFKPVRTFDSGGGYPNSVVVADLNQDGKPDLVVTNCGPFDGDTFCPTPSRGVLAIFLGNGDGTFQRPMLYDSGGSSPMQAAVADVNLDGKLDVLVANQCADAPVCTAPGGVTVFLGNGDGTLQSASTPWGLFAGSMAVADVNADGRPDLLVTAIDGVDVLLGNGDGSFQPPVDYRVPGLLAAYGLAVADFNHDGRPDVVAAGIDRSNRGRVGVLFGDGDGTFTPGANYNTSGRVVLAVAVADVNGDGHPDLIVGNCTSTCVSEDGSIGVLVGTGDGFRPAALYDSGLTSAWSVAVADLNGDGKPDVVVGHWFTNSVSVLINQTVPFAYPTSTSVASSLNPSVYGQKVTWTATVTKSGAVAPTGKVRFTWGSSTLGTVSLNSSGVATLTRSKLNADAYPLTAVYLGDASNLCSTSPVLNQIVTQSTSSATLTSSPNPSSPGEAVTFTAKISSPTVQATGPVTFTAGKLVLGTVELSNGKATFTSSTLATGSTKVTVTYDGDSNIQGSSASVTQVVQQSVGSGSSSTALTYTENPSTLAETFTATVTSSSGTPSGTVTFTVGSTTLGTVALTSGQAILNATTLAVGSNTVTATYSGNSEIGASSAWVTQTFVMPVTGTLSLQQEGGSAGATTTFGIGTSSTNFVPYYTGLPNNPNPTGELLVGTFPAGTLINFGMYTTFGGQSGYAFSTGTDQASIVSFADLSNSLGMDHGITQQTSPTTWLLHLDDAESYLVDDDNNDVLMELIVVPN